ncbi:MAG: cation:proton antiporter [Bdellovibrionales bacterium]
MHIALISVAVLFFTGHALGWFFEKTKIPDLLILVIIGYVVGPILGYLSPADFGKAGALLSTLALVVILYEGGLHLTAKELAEGFLTSASLAVLGFIGISVLAGLVAFTLGGQPFHIALLLGLGIGSTSSAVVIPMVKPLSIDNNTKTILSLESAITDVLAIVIFLVAVDGIVAGEFSAKALLVGLGPNTLLAALYGIAGGLVWAALKKHFGPVFKMAFAGEAWALLNYGLLELAGLNGAIGVLTLGFMLANLDLLPGWLKSQMSSVPVSYRDLSFLNTLTFMLKTFFFIYLGVLVKFSDPVIVALAFLITLLIFASRYLVINITMKKATTSRLDAMITTAMGPRGLACAVLATVPLQKGIVGGQWLQDIIFAIIPLTILFTAFFVSLFENKKVRSKFSKLWLKYSEPDELAPLQD